MADTQQRRSGGVSGGEVDVTRKKGKKGRRSNQAQGPDSLDANPADYVRILPAPHASGGHPDESLGPTVLLSTKHKAPGLELSADRLSVSGSKGYRSVRATHGFHEGTHYCEVTLAHLGGTGHARVGWGTAAAEINGPVGYDTHGYGVRDVDGARLHAAQRVPVDGDGAPLRQGDVLGLFLHLPPGGDPVEVRPGSNLVRYKGGLWAEAPAPRSPRPLPGSVLAFTVNGVLQGGGPAFTDLLEGTYYPMLSVFTLPVQGEGVTLTVNFGPDFSHAPPVLEGCPPAEPLSVLPERLRAAAEADEAAALGGGGGGGGAAVAAGGGSSGGGPVPMVMS
jgi:Set1/Ash2 histone methyltransferase complex subunit ASH2